ncbi:hypothetical protein PS6_009857 [Mucor atramentarius]
MSSSYFPSIYSLFERKKASKKTKSDQAVRPQSITTRSSTSSTTVVKCGYDELYYDDDTERDLQDLSSDDDSDSTYCIIDNFRSLPFKRLAEMHNIPESFSGDDQDIISEFTFLLAQIKQICQQLDSCRGAVQFAETDETIGQKLKEIVLFTCNRYHENTSTGDSVPEVKEQLLHRTRIGRCIIVNMLVVLKDSKNKFNTPRMLYDQINFMQILFDCPHLKSPNEMPNMIDTLAEAAAKFASIDKDWYSYEDYTTVISFAKDFFSY